MAHPDPRRGGSEKGQRQHAGRTSEYSDAGMKNKSQGTPAKGPSTGTGPEASRGHEHQRVAGGTGGTSGQSVKTNPSTQGTPPLKAKTSKVSKKSAPPEGDGADVSD